MQNGGAFDAANKLTEDNDFLYFYTTNGNLLTKRNKVSGEEVRYEWNQLDQLTKISIYNQANQLLRSASFKYDASQRRIERTQGSETTKYLYDGDNIIAEFNQNNEAKAYYMHGLGIDNVLAMWKDLNNDHLVTEDEIFFFTKDHLNSTQEITTMNEELVQRYNYKAYGEMKVLRAGDELGKKLEFARIPFTFQGREQEEISHDICFRSRCLSPQTGRWLQEDKIGFDGGVLNLYEFVSSRPNMEVDPQGKALPIAFVAAGAASGALTGGVIGYVTSSSCSFLGKVGDGVISGIVGAFGGAVAGIGVVTGSGIIGTGATLFGGTMAGAGTELIGMSLPSFSGHGCPPPVPPKTPEPPKPPSPPTTTAPSSNPPPPTPPTTNNGNPPNSGSPNSCGN